MKWNNLIASNPESAFWPEVMFYKAYIDYKLHKYMLSNRLIMQMQQNTNVNQMQNERARLLQTANYLTLREWNKAEKSLAGISSSGHLSDSKILFSSYLEGGKKIQLKNPYLAAGFSAIIPGSGKIYVGKTIDGVFSFFLLSFVSWQAYIGFSENQMESVKGWVFSGIGAVFYIGNIYGSTIAAKIHNQKVNNAFDKQIRIVLQKAIGN